MADIDADHALGALLQQAVGEAARGLAHVEAPLALRRHLERRQRAFELEPAARHIARRGLVQQLQLGIAGEVFAVLLDGLPHARGRGAPLDARSNQALRLRA
ncbi:hypothetical protein D3C71_1702840 [compost metagenome]